MERTIKNEESKMSHSKENREHKSTEDSGGFLSAGKQGSHEKERSKSLTIEGAKLTRRERTTSITKESAQASTKDKSEFEDKFRNVADDKHNFKKEIARSHANRSEEDRKEKSHTIRSEEEKKEKPHTIHSEDEKKERHKQNEKSGSFRAIKRERERTGSATDDDNECVKDKQRSDSTSSKESTTDAHIKRPVHDRRRNTFITDLIRTVQETSSKHSHKQSSNQVETEGATQNENVSKSKGKSVIGVGFNELGRWHIYC